MNRAGIVKTTPEAREEEAEPAVCPMFTSRIELFPIRGRSTANAATMITASGIEVLMVRPTFRPR
jgi:hypothetical protein